MNSHSKPELQNYIADVNNSKESHVAQSLEHQGDSNIQSINLDEGMSIWEARQMFQRVLAGWASDVLTLRQSRLHEMRWNRSEEENDLSDDYLLAA